MKSFLYAITIFLFVLFAACHEKASDQILIKDNAGLLFPSQVDSLNKLLNNYYFETGKQFLVYTIGNIGGTKSIENYTDELLKRIDYGEGGFDNSILLFIYYDEHSLILRWGKNFQKKMTDSIANSIIKKVSEDFKDLKYSKGIEHALGIIKDVSIKNF